MGISLEMLQAASDDEAHTWSGVLRGQTYMMSKLRGEGIEQSPDYVLKGCVKWRQVIGNPNPNDLMTSFKYDPLRPPWGWRQMRTFILR